MSSSPTHKAANLARIRENQRRSRARKREYVQELENRIRLCEIQGVEASAEVQLAARRVAEENRQLRGLLNQHGIDDRSIAQYLQSTTASRSDPSQNTIPPISGETPAQSLQQLMIPRRPASSEPTMVYPVPTRESRENSSASISTTASSMWETSPTSAPAAFSHTSTIAVPTSMTMTHTPPQHYHVPPPLPSSMLARQSSFNAPPPSTHPVDPGSQHHYTTQPLSQDQVAAMAYTIQMNPYQHPGGQNYQPPGGY